MAAADVGVAMGVAGTALAVEAADVALFTNELASLPFAAALGRHTANVILINLTFAIGVSGVRRTICICGGFGVLVCANRT
jgi:Zn2+/Cd2+-exporting ATPase